jgi:hypothetical protein
MLVATVTDPMRPAWVTMRASFSCCLALRTEWGMPRFSSWRERNSDFSLVVPDHVAVGGDRDDLDVVGVGELAGLRDGRAGHAGQLVVEAEVVLERDRGEGLVLLFDLHALFGLDGLVEPLAPAPALEDATGELVDDLDLAVGHDVVDVVLEQLLGPQRRLELVDEVLVDVVVEVLDAERLLDPGDPLLGGGDRLLLLVDLVVALLLERGDDAGELGVEDGGVVDRPGDDERRAGLVDEDRVDLVDDGEVVAPLGHVSPGRGHVVAQVVEPELVVGAVGDVAAVGGPLLLGLVELVGDDEPDGEAEEPVDPAHPLGVALGQVVVDGDQVDALARQAVEVGRQRGDQGLALPGLHLGHPPEVEGRPAHQLDVVVTLPEHPPGGLPDGGERLGEEVVKVLPPVEPVPELHGLGRQLIVRQLLDLGLKGPDLGDDPLQRLELPAFAQVEDLVENTHSPVSLPTAPAEAASAWYESPGGPWGSS